MKETAIGIIVTIIIIVAIVVAVVGIVKALIRKNHLKSRKQMYKEELDKTKIQDL